MKEINNFFIDFAKTDFKCPHCKRLHRDVNDKYFNKINKNKSWMTKVNCDCGQSFKLTIDYKGNFETFKK